MKIKKGIVVEADQKYAIILLPGGEYRKVRTAGQYLEPGDLYEHNPVPMVKYAVAAVLMLAFLVGGIDYNSVKAHARLGSDLELGINRWGRVVSVEAKSETGKQILDSVKIDNDKVEVAVEKISRQAMQDEYSRSSDIRHNLKVTAKDKKNTVLQKNIIKEMEKGLEKADKTADPINKNKVQDKSKNSRKSNNGIGNVHDINWQETEVKNKILIINKQVLDEENDDYEQPAILSEENTEEQETRKEQQKNEKSELKQQQKFERLEKKDEKNRASGQSNTKSPASNSHKNKNNKD
jgi:hypothetical protein